MEVGSCPRFPFNGPLKPVSIIVIDESDFKRSKVSPPAHSLDNEVVTISDDDDDRDTDADDAMHETHDVKANLQAVFTRADKKYDRKRNHASVEKKPVHDPMDRTPCTRDSFCISPGKPPGTGISGIFEEGPGPECSPGARAITNGCILEDVDKILADASSNVFHAVPLSEHASTLSSTSGDDLLPDLQLSNISSSSNGRSYLEHAISVNGGLRDRAFILCTDNSKRLRSSAVRDYPAGCRRISSILPVCEHITKAKCKDSVVFVEESSGERMQDTPDLLEGEICRPHFPEGAGGNGGPVPPAQANVGSCSVYLEDGRTTSLECALGQPFGDGNASAKQEEQKPRPNSSNSSIDQNMDAISEHAGAIVPIRSCETKGPIGLLKHKNLDSGAGTSARSLVRKTLQDFDYIRKTLLKNKTSRRPDLEAGSILKKNGRWINNADKIVGDVPGIHVGDQFTFRFEMLIIGLHRQTQAGIAIGKGVNGEQIATSIVASGGYEDDDDNGDTFTYTGQGGNNYKGDRRQARNQELVRGNLALKNSCEGHYPVRVIRGSSEPASPNGKLYTYDGLYNVVDCFFKTGAAGHWVWQFKLVRQPGQAELGSSMVRFVGTLKKKGLARPHVLLEDISGGQERLAVCVVNEVDTDEAPTYFVYVPHIKYPIWHTPTMPRGCDCVGGCTDERKCLCAAKNGGEFPYNESGQIIWGKQVIYECGSSCQCSSSCHNRVSQRGLRYQLEIFKTKNRGWGVRSLESIRSGGFICEYTGELLSDAEAEQRTGSDEYLFDLGNRCFSVNEGPSLMGTSESSAIVPMIEEAGFTIDAKGFGSVARFINHSCSPNLFTQNVLYDSDDLKFPHVMLFAMENIPPMRELNYDYNYSVGQVRDANGNVKTKACYCGAQDCQGRLY